MRVLHQQRDDNDDDDDDDDDDDVMMMMMLLTMMMMTRMMTMRMMTRMMMATITMTNIETHSPHQPYSDSSRRLLPYLQDQTHHPAFSSLNSCSAARASRCTAGCSG